MPAGKGELGGDALSFCLKFPMAFSAQQQTGTNQLLGPRHSMLPPNANFEFVGTQY